jgi:uncharacterized protein YndB with AHSA1/START domain
MITLRVRRTVRAEPARVFAAWTDPGQLQQWWGPAGAKCVAAQMDLRVGGSYRIGNQFADGRLLWIVGEFECIEPPHRLVYSWRLESQPGPVERVTVTFTARAPGRTTILVRHQRIADRASRDRHRLGWVGCLTGLADYLNAAQAR